MATKAEINNYADELETLAADIADDVVLLGTHERGIETIETDLEAMRAAIVSNVANARFEANGKLQFTNDDQRKSAVIETQNADAQFQAQVVARRNLIQTATGTRAVIEQQRKSFRAKELVLLYHANSPPPTGETGEPETNGEAANASLGR